MKVLHTSIALYSYSCVTLASYMPALHLIFLMSEMVVTCNIKIIVTILSVVPGNQAPGT